MTPHSELAGLVKPYYGRSTPRDSAATAVSGAAMSASAQVTGATLAQLVLTASAQDIIRAAVQWRGWMMTEADQTWDVAVPIGTDRRQIVSVDFERHDELGQPLVVYSSNCGPATNRNAMALLRRNARLYQTAFAVESRGDVALIVLRGAQQPEAMDLAAAARMIEAIARHADSVERKLVGTDEF